MGDPKMLLPGNNEETDRGHTGITALVTREKTMDSSSRSPLEEILSVKKKAGTASCCSLKTGHFYFGNNRTFLFWLDSWIFFVANTAPETYNNCLDVDGGYVLWILR